MNHIEPRSDHYSVTVGDQCALVDACDLDTVRQHHWTPHPRGPIAEIYTSRSPRVRKYLLLSMAIYGHPVSFHNCNRFDLRRENVVPARRGYKHNLKNGGVFFRDGSWIAAMRYSGKQYRLCFSSRKFGNQMAEDLARQARKMMEVAGSKSNWLKRGNAFGKFQLKHAKAPSPTGRKADADFITRFVGLYIKHEQLPIEMAIHLERMWHIGGGRMPAVEHRSEFGRVNLYEGNHDYENCPMEGLAQEWFLETYGDND